MTDLREKLQALVKGWRKRADALRKAGDEFPQYRCAYNAEAGRVDDCADQLAQVLAEQELPHKETTP